MSFSWQQYGDTPELACNALYDRLQDRIRQVDAYFSLQSELLVALKKAEAADLFHSNCPECEGEELPEKCGHCFPLADDARVMRRLIIAKVEG